MRLLPLKGAWLKIKRAKEHFREFNSLVEGYNRDGQTPFTQVDEMAGEYKQGLRIYEMPDLEWGLVVGDAIHNLRSALDIMVCDMVVEFSGVTAITHQTQFPFVYDWQLKQGLLDPEINKRVVGASPDAITYIKRLNPYEGGNQILWNLHRLDIIDKHSSIIISGLGIDTKVSIVAATRDPAESPLPKGSTEFLEVTRRPTEIFTEGGNSVMKMEFPKPLQIVFHETGFLEGEPIVPALRNFYGHVLDIVDKCVTLNLFKTIGSRPDNL